jgi:RNA polymerase II subunit A C-terminal domain phosphatase
MICAFLDENGRLFSHRILSRDECLNATSKKDNLKALFPDDCGDSMVCIIDDREDVWNHATNLIQVKPYHFFQHTGDINAPPNLAKRELDGEGVDFNKVLKLHKKIKIKEKSPASTSSDENNATMPKEEGGGEEDSNSSEKKEEETEKMDEDVEKKNDDVENSKEADEKTENDKANEDGENSKNSVVDDDNLVEIQDPDDYLLYLETILMRIHERFYKQYDDKKDIPDLKTLVPQLKSEVLVGISIVFSGLVPNNVKIEYSRPYLIATNLGAKVQDSITEETTHLVAASTGTQKVFQAQKLKKVHVVTPEWLWTCAERWERVEEKLFPVTSNRSHKMRHVPAHCSPERIPEPSQAKFNNPYLQMSDDDIASMEAEVEDDSTDTDSDDEREDTPEAERVKRKRKRSEVIEASPLAVAPINVNQTIDISGGLNKKKVKEEDFEEEEKDSGDSQSSSSESETLSTKFRRGECGYKLES